MDKVWWHCYSKNPLAGDVPRITMCELSPRDFLLALRELFPEAILHSSGDLVVRG